MPYTIQTKDGITLQLDDSIDPNDPRVKEAVLAERAQRAQGKRDTATQNEVQAEQDRFKQEEASRPWAQRMAANVGAGMTNLAQGVQQLTGNATDEDVRDKRAMDQQLADSTTGGRIGQITGEILPTLVVPAGSAVRGLAALGRVARVLPRAAEAAQAARVGAGIGEAAQAARLGTGSAILDSSAIGAATGGLAPVDSSAGESRLVNAGIGAAAGAVLPAAVAAGRGVWHTVSTRGAASKAADELVNALDSKYQGGAAQARNDLGTYYPKGAEEIPLSTAATLDSDAIAKMERGSRMRDQTGAWAQHDASQNASVWDNVQKATDTANDREMLQGIASQNLKQGEAKAFENINPADAVSTGEVAPEYQKFMDQARAFRANLDQALDSPEGGNPTVAGAIKFIRNSMDRLASEGKLTPQHLAEYRRQLAGQVTTSMGDTNPLTTAPRSNGAMMSIRNGLDEVLDNSSGGKWSDVNAQYAADKAPVNSAQAEAAIRNAFQTAQGVNRTPVVGGAPTVTSSRLANTVANAGENEFGDQLRGEARSQLAATMEALRRRDITQRVGRAASPGGPTTASDLFGSQAIDLSRSVLGAKLGPIVDVARKLARGKADDEMTRLLANPADAVAAIERKLANNKPLSTGETMLLTAIQRAGQGTAAALPATLAASGQGE